ncbi:MAG: PAS domain S-box protein [Syntrophobacteraceae bacterium]|jgi:PAS domain S-box-containing protein
MNTQSHPIRVLLIDDDEDDYIIVRDLLSALSSIKFILKWVSDYEAALDAILSNEFDVCLLDYRIKERNGLELMQEAVSCGAMTPIVFLTGERGHFLDLEAISKGADDWLPKCELNGPLLERSIRHTIERQRKKEELIKAKRIIQALSECNHSVIHIKDETELLRAICRIVVDVGGYRMAWVGYAEDDRDQTVTPVAKYGYEKDYLETVKVTWKDAERGRGPTGTCIRTGTPNIIRSVTQAEFAPWKVEASKRGYASVIGLPLPIDGRKLGALTIYSSEPDAFDTEEAEFLVELSSNLSYGIGVLRLRKAQMQAEESLKEANLNLERRVDERTAELAKVNAELRKEVEERRQAEEAFRESREFLGKIANSISDPIFVKDRQHRFVLVNDALCALAGRQREDILGRTDYDFFPKDQVDIFLEKDEIVFDTGQGNENEEEVTDARGQTRTIVTKKTLYTDKAENKFIVGVIRDITERKKAELALQSAHRELQDIVEFLPDATVVVDRDKKVIYWNRAMEEMTGVEKRNILGQSDYAYAVPFYGKRRPMLIDLLIAEEPEIENRYDFVKRMGKTIYAEGFVPGAYQGKGAYLWSTAAPLIGRDGNIIGAIQSIRDISDRKQAEETVRQSEEKYRQLFATVSDAILLFDADSRRCIDVNESAINLYGYTRDEFLGLKHTEITAEPDLSEESIDETLARIRTKVPLRYHRKKDGTVFPVEISSSTFNLPGLRVLCGVVRDITERIRAEEAIKQQINFQQTLIDTIPSPIFYENTENRYLGCNSSFESYIGLCKADIIGKIVYEVAPKDLADIYREADLALFREPGLQQYETCFQYADGSRHDVLFIKGTFTDLDGKAAGLVGVMLDITKRKRAERELSEYRDHLEDLVKERTAELAITNEQLTREVEERRRAEQALQCASEKLKFFAYSVAHDLKSPAIGLYGLTKRLSKQAKNVLDEKGRTYCDQILKVSEHIAALVEKINIYIATKEAAPLIETTNIAEILRMLKDEFSVQLSLRRIDWFAPESEVKIEADRLSVLRIFRNLIDNALKYGGEGLTRISIGYEDSENLHIFSVSDNGKGLKEADYEKIFGLFQRNETSRGVEGAGLGLTIVKEIAEQHGGKVWVEPAAKRGATFFVSISKKL